MEVTYLNTGSYYTSDGIRNCEEDKYEQNNLSLECYIDKYHGKYDILNQYTIKDLAQLILSFIVKRLYVGDLVDVLDTEHKWYLSYIEDIKNDNIYIHYLGWKFKWDEWISISSDRIRLSGQMVPGICQHAWEYYYHHSLKEIKFPYSRIFVIHFQQNKQIYITTHLYNFLDNIVINDRSLLNHYVVGYYIYYHNYIIKIDK